MIRIISSETIVNSVLISILLASFRIYHWYFSSLSKGPYAISITNLIVFFILFSFVTSSLLVFTWFNSRIEEKN